MKKIEILYKNETFLKNFAIKKGNQGLMDNIYKCKEKKYERFNCKTR